MCLAVPVRVERLLDNEMAVVEMDGLRKEISLALVDG
ncbi:hydrogenase assembly chaperone HypC, partial [Acidithiobacillus sp. GGI-221]